MNILLELNGLNCTNCAEKIKDMSKKLMGVKSSDLNFITKKLYIELENDTYYAIVKEEVISIINKLEPDVEVVELSLARPSQLLVELNGLDCMDCASKIEKYASEFKGVRQANFNFATKKFTMDLEAGLSEKDVFNQLKELVNRLEPNVQLINLSQQDADHKLRLAIENIHCSDCAANIEKRIMELEAVDGADLNIVSKKLEVSYRPGTDLTSLRQSIEKIVAELEPKAKVMEVERVLTQPKVKKSFWEKLDKDQLVSIGLSIGFFVLAKLFQARKEVSFLLYLASYLVIGSKIIKQAYVNTRAGVPFDENFLMSIATIGAFAIGEYPEAIMVMLLYQIGETLQAIAVNHSRESITALMDIRPDYANLLDGDQEVQVDPNQVKIGDVILVKPGERVPLDGVVVDGKSFLDTSSITGESVPRGTEAGEEIVSGVVNIQGLLKIRVTKLFGESTISKILDLVENASSKKAETENFITRFSRYYTPVVVFIAAILALAPPLLGMGAFSEWFYRAAVFLVISCPCALVISVPLGFFGGLGAGSKEGVLIKGSNYLEALADVDTLVFDKTGTLTEGVFEVSSVSSYVDGLEEDQILRLAAHGERYSNHPIGKSVMRSYQGIIDESIISDYEEIPGQGIKVRLGQELYLLGNKKLMLANKISITSSQAIGSIIYMAKDQVHIASILVADRIKPSAKSDLNKLRQLGVKKLIMLSGDSEQTVDKVADSLGLDQAYGGLLPQDKVAIFEEIIASKSKKDKVAFVGDGVNDAPVLARADVGIAMGGLGSDAAIEASDVVIMTDDIGKISKGIEIGRKTRRIVSQNIALALGVKLIVLLLGAMGQASMWQAVFADVGVSIIAILNSIRVLNTKDLK